jgi:FSR family fosmidomycin resistance protein-like MFS transporter
VVPAVVEPGGVGATPLLAVPALLMAGVTVAVLRSHPAPSSAPPRDPGGTLLSDRWGPFLRLTGVVMSRSVMSFGLAAFLALYAQQRLDAGTVTGEMVLLVFFIASAVGTLVGGRHSRITIMRVSYSAALPGLALLVFAPGAAFVLGAAWTGLAINLPFSLHVTLGQDYLPHRIGTASGVTLGLAVSVGGLAAPVVGAVADATSLQAALAGMLLLPLVAGAFTLGLDDPLRR